MPNGKVTKMPAQLKKRLVLIEEICRAFDVGKTYTEKEVNLIICSFTTFLQLSGTCGRCFLRIHFRRHLSGNQGVYPNVFLPKNPETPIL